MASTGQAETTAREALMHAYVEAWNLHDADAVAAFFSQDAVYDDRGAGRVLRGSEAIRSYAGSVHAAVPDLRFEIVRAAHGDYFSAAEWTSTMTHTGAELEGLKATGRRVETAGVDVATLDEEGQITHLVSYYDGAGMMRQLGLLPPRGSRVERALIRAASLLPRRS